MKRFWWIWCKTIGSKISDNDREADIAAILRTFWVLLNAVACIFLIINIIHHW